jgi:hypothetical protein
MKWQSEARTAYGKAARQKDIHTVAALLKESMSVCKEFNGNREFSAALERILNMEQRLKYAAEMRGKS